MGCSYVLQIEFLYIYNLQRKYIWGADFTRERERERERERVPTSKYISKKDYHKLLNESERDTERERERERERDREREK